MSIKVFIENNPRYFNVIKYTIDLIFKNKDLGFNIVGQKEDADLIIDNTAKSDINIFPSFYQKIKEEKFSHSHHLKDDFFIRNSIGEKDVLATIFYLVNCLQEYGFPESKLDHYGRFPFEESLQSKYDIIERNVVQEIIDDLFKNHPKLSKLKTSDSPSQLLTSHDIDFIYTPAKRELKWAIKNLKPFAAFKFFSAWISKRSLWLDIESIVALNSLYNYPTHLFWITQNDKNQNIYNGDYDFQSDFIKNKIEESKSLGCFNHLHKSTNCDSFNQESKPFKSLVTQNRYHYLKYELPTAWDELEVSNINVDHSLAFGSKMGFRNNYGKAFKPYNLKKEKAYDFTVVPFQIMDSTFMYYNKSTPEQNLESIKSFISKHKINTLLSVVWHNTSFTNYSFKTQKQQYVAILEHCKSLGIKAYPKPNHSN